MSAPKRLVVKVGSSLLADEERLTVRYAFMHGLISDIAALRDEGWDVVLTSSGAVALGLNAIGKSPARAGVLDKQAAAACGMPLLLNAYKQIAMEHQLNIAQVLVTLADLEKRRRFLNTRNTILHLFERDVVPIVNENDTMTTEELKVGDNDRLAAKVAQMVQADHMVLLTNVDGLYDRNPAEEGAQLIETVEETADFLDVADGAANLGSGGMLTKIQAANMAQNAGCEAIIGRGILDRPISSLLNNERPHTRCIAKGTPSSSWKVWLTNRLQVTGSIRLTADASAVFDAENGTIRQEDIAAVWGEFEKGDVIHIYNDSDEEIARGLTNCPSHETALMAQQPDDTVVAMLGYKNNPIVVGAENLVVLEDHHLTHEAPTELNEAV